MARKLDLSNTAQFRKALSRAGTASGAAANAALFGLSSRMRYREIPLAQVEPNPEQPRRDARHADIETLAASIAQRGLLQPINVQEVAPDRFRIVAGERRYWAFHSLEREAIPALVIDTDDPQALALLENVQRVDLHPIELAQSLRRLIEDKGLVQEQAAVLIGRSQEYVARLLGILKLPADILDEVPARPGVSVSVLMELAELGDAGVQRALWTRAGDGLTVKEIRQAKQARRDGGAVAAGPVPPYDPLLRNLRRTVFRLRALDRDGVPLDEARRDELRNLRDEIDAMIGD
ncbi:ParB/RepB/Spo0J family partition protein [Azospirillum sp. ST 5-10]|uniref:ParB/RepB/Spo0J family partition protein n=1 Tax=unclassified Azospirillum TaxID=2630922 RepID=UPI003F4A00F2